jgi:hypothetical protein
VRAGGGKAMLPSPVCRAVVRDYLAPGEHFALLHGCDIARGTVTRRIFV